MARYIDADKLLKKLISKAHIICDNQSRCEGMFLSEIQKNICKAPTVDVQPVVHGFWSASREENQICSECDKILSGFIHANYCPNCGAKMDGGSTK